MKNELTIDAIDTLIFNSLWEDDLPMVGHVKDDGYFLLKFSDGDNFVSLKRQVGETVYVLEMKTSGTDSRIEIGWDMNMECRVLDMRTSGTDSRVIFHLGSSPLITTPTMIIDGIHHMISHIFKTATS
ncbi:hypothetical protein [Thiolapillus sp.]|uniref:hypothetical protein n=1 Tax=Thiolapillus sp. TaxID=2017437 RepID=UPI003AF6D33A